MKRRARSTGTIIYLPKRGCHRGRLPLGNGKYKYFYGRDEGELRDRLDQARLDLKRGIQPTVGRDTFARYLPEWLDSVRATVRETTWPRYETICRVHLVPKFGRKRLVDLTASQVLAFEGELQRVGYKPHYIRAIHNVLRHALKDAQREHLVAENVLRDVKPPSLDETDPETLDEQMRKDFLQEGRQTPYSALYALALGTGMRQAELLGLRWSDVVFERGVLHVRRQRVRVRDLEHQTYLVKVRDILKTKRSHRDITIGPALVAILRDHKSAQGKLRLLLGPVWQGPAKHDDDYCFANDLGGLANAESLQNHIKKLFKRLEFSEKLHFHSLRHTHATMLLEAGEQPHTVAQRLGDSVQTMLRVYARVTEKMKHQAARTTDELLWPEAR